MQNLLKLILNLYTSSDINKKTDLKGQNKIIDIVKRLNATKYINAIGGKELYEKDTFKKARNQIILILGTELSAYKQFKNNFVPNLSIIDVMMFNSVDEIKKMLNTFKLGELTKRKYEMFVNNFIKSGDLSWQK